MPNHDVQRLAERYPARRVLITGATSGLGEALALEFARHGWRIGVSGRSPDKVGLAARKVREVGGDALEIRLEVTDRRQFEDAAAIVERTWGGLDILINNAGIASGGRIDELTPESWRTALDTNLWGVIHGCTVFVPVLRCSGGGHIVNVSSGAGFICAPEMASYSVSKAGVIALTETLRVELALDRIRCTVTCPGLFRSGIFDPAKIESASGVGRVVTSLRILMSRSGWTSEEVARRTIRAVRRNQLYDFPHADIRALWHLKRLFPTLFRRVLGWMFVRRLWLFAEIDQQQEVAKHGEGRPRRQPNGLDG